MYLGGRATNSLFFFFFFLLFCISRICDPVANDTRCIIPNLKVFKTYSRWSWHITFLHGLRSEGVFSRVACGGCTILIIVQNDHIKYMLSALATP